MDKQRRPSGRKARLAPGIILTLAAYLCVLGVAIRTDGLVEAQAEQQKLIAEAQSVRESNIAAEEQARKDSVLLAETHASVLSEIQKQSTEEAKAAAEEDAEKEKAEKAKTEQEKTDKEKSEAEKVPAGPALGTFMADAYGYSGKDKLSYWQGINNDVIGYLRIPGTNISHAVVQNTNDVNYYTKRGYYKEDSYYGVLWTNPNTNSSGSSANMSSNTVIYGHNWTNYSANPRIGSANDIMFGQLTGYHHLSMAKSYPYFYYSTSQEAMVFKIFAAFYTEPQFKYNVTEGDMQSIISEAQRRSRHTFDVDVNSSDKIITLSTCTRAYGQTSNQRFVVMGRLLRPGETISEVNVTSNPNHKQPSVW